MGSQIADMHQKILISMGFIPTFAHFGESAPYPGSPYPLYGGVTQRPANIFQKLDMFWKEETIPYQMSP